MVKNYSIWSEGYAITGQSSGAMLHSTVSASSFKEACDIYFKDNSYYDSNRGTLWGCKLFDNEVDARKSFG